MNGVFYLISESHGLLLCTALITAIGREHVGLATQPEHQLKHRIKASRIKNTNAAIVNQSEEKKEKNFNVKEILAKGKVKFGQNKGIIH